MYRALICCRAGMGSSMLLKIKVDECIKEANLPIETQHGNMDEIFDFDGDLIITMEDLATEIQGKVNYALGVRNIMDKNEIQAKLDEFLKTK